MIRFESDYLEGALPEIMAALSRTNLEQTPGYGKDVYCESAAGKIRALCEAPEADVHFLVGGTQANFTVISAALRTHQGVIAAESGHIAVHETGSVEATGHKVLTLPSADGKIAPEQISALMDEHLNDASREHAVQPAMVYISQPTEYGTVYTLAELEGIAKTCREYGLYLFVDGARLGTALCCSDVTLPDLARLSDCFYIGGTKLGCLFGEAVVIMNADIKKDFRYVIKQHGGMFAKGRLLGLQFDTLMTDGLYERTGRRETELAMRLRRALEDMGYKMLYDSPTNQQFPVLPDAVLDELSEKYSFSEQRRVDETHRAVRFCTSWATRPEDVDGLIKDVKAFSVK